MRTYSGDIETLKTNQVFVFGSNTQGRHGKGAALVAVQKFGAIYGQAEGLQGKSFAIITKDLTKQKHPSRTPEQIKAQIKKLYDFALLSDDKEFLIAYKATGSNLNAYSAKEMAEMFNGFKIPENIVFEQEFSKLIINIKIETMEVTGILKVKSETEKVSDKFSKREFVLTTESNTPYPQHISFQLTQDKCSVLDGYNIGEEIKVQFNLRGREWNGPNGVKYFNTLEAWRIEKKGAAAVSENKTPATKTNVQAPAKTEENSAPIFHASNDNDDLPF